MFQLAQCKFLTSSIKTFFGNHLLQVASVTNNHQSFPSIEVSVQSKPHVLTQKQEAEEAYSQNQQEYLSPTDLTELATGKDNRGNITSDAKPSQPSDDQEEGDGDQREPSTAAAGASSDDGFNWRKYGQKQVKGSEYPRSYYKCTHPNCQVKKKVERSQEGHVTEIIYKGAHNHPKPPPNRRTVIGSSYLPGEMDGVEQPGARVGFHGEPAWVSSQHGAGTAGSNWRHDDIETASAATEFFDPSTSAVVQNGSHFEMADAIDVSSTMSNNDDEDDQVTHGSVSLGNDEEGDESESKRR